MIDKVTLTLDVRIEFAGRHQVTFEYEPVTQDDPFLVAVLDKLHERNAIAIAGGLTTFEII